MKKIEIKIPGRGYPIFLGKGLSTRVGKIAGNIGLNQNLFLVADRKIAELHKEKVETVIRGFGGKLFVHLFDSDEKNKSLSGAEQIYTDLINNGFGRDTTVAALGGGITGDIAGFVSSTFARGVQFIQIPTTLLAAVDSAVGGKTGINFGNTKNIVGTFSQPRLVVIDTDFFKTLPAEEIICGAGEILKYAFLIDRAFFTIIKKGTGKLLRLDPVLTERIIETCVRFKGNVVAKDEKESGLRKILNLGHTFAHAFEIEQGYSIKHGQAVIVGLACALELSKTLGLINPADFDKCMELPLIYRNKIELHAFDADLIYEIMKRDKKGSNQKIKFVLMKDIGRILVNIGAERGKVVSAVKDGAKHFLN